MSVTLELVGANSIRPEIVDDLVKDILIVETGSFVDQKVFVRMYGGKRRSVRSPDYAAAIQHKWDARKQKRVLTQEVGDLSNKRTSSQKF